VATTWGLGDYPRMAERLEPAARAAVELAGIAPGERVLDIACGTGNAAIAAAERGAHAVGVDFEPALLAIARERAPGVELHTGDAAALPVEDGEFDAVVSIFGVMYAPDHEAAARELARVTKPGGRIALAAWTPGSLMPRMGAALAPYLPPPPPSSGPPSRWGDEDQLAAILDAAGITIESMSRARLALDADVDFLIETAGHVLAERERLEDEGRWQALRDDLQALVDANPPAEYLLAAARL
jgi:SAM-dependent methyltransferase